MSVVASVGPRVGDPWYLAVHNNTCFTAQKCTLCFIQSKLDIRTRIADARVPDIETLAALFISHPLDLSRPASLLQLRQCAKEDPDRVASTDCVLCLTEVIGKIEMGLRGFRRGEGQYFHCFVIQDGNRLVDRVVCGGRWAIARETNSACGVGRWLWIVEGVGESCPPNERVVTQHFTGKHVTCNLPMTKITGDDAKCVLSHEERCDDFPESGFCLAIYRTDEDRNNRYVQPGRMVNPGRNPGNGLLTLRTPYARKVDAFRCCARLRRSVYPCH